MRSPIRLAAALLLAVLALAAALAGCSRQAAMTGTTAPSGPAGTRAPISYSRALIARASTDWLAIDGVQGDGITIDEDGSASVLVLTDRADRALPTSVQGVPVHAIVAGPFQAFALTDRLRPVPIGASLGNNQECLPGTVGAIVTKGGKRYVLCANHVLARENQAAIGEDEVQPSRVDASAECSPLAASFVIGKLAEFEPLRFDGTANRMDAAIAELVAPATAATPAGFYGVPGATPVAPSHKLAITKVGRTTGQTFGRIRSTDVEVKVTLPLGIAVYSGQFITSNKFGDFGDSGSLVVTDDATHAPVGMMIGGDPSGAAICTPIQPILARFGVTIARP